jgi:hypothetical protein
MLLFFIGLVTMVTRNRKSSRTAVPKKSEITEVKEIGGNIDVIIDHVDTTTHILVPIDLEPVKLDLSKTQLDGVEARAAAKEAEARVASALRSREIKPVAPKIVNQRCWADCSYSNLANVLGVPTEGYPGMSESGLREEITRLWKVKDPTKFEPRFKNLLSCIRKTHYDHAIWILKQSPDCTIKEASDMLLDLLVDQTSDNLSETVDLLTISSWTLPFRYFSMRVKSDYLKATIYGKHELLAYDESSPYFKSVVGHSVSIRETPEHREILKETWDWFASMTRVGESLPHFMIK